VVIMVKMAGDSMRTSRAAGILAAAIGGAATLAGCGQEPNVPASSPVAPHIKAAGAVKKGPTADELTAGMAAAPALGKSVLPVDLKFELAQRPKIGQPLEINLALLPQIAGGPATVQVTDADGLDAQSDDPFDIPAVEPGEVYRHTVRLTPNTDGVLLVDLTVSLQHDDVSDSKVFAVPVIVDR